MSLDSLLESALEVSLASHPNPQSVPTIAEALCHPNEALALKVSQLLNSGASVAGVIVACASFLRLECDLEGDATILESFAARFSLLEAAGQ